MRSKSSLFPVYFGLTLLSTVTIFGQAPAIASVVNSASFRSGIAEGSWVTVTGSNLSSTTRAWTGADIVNGQLPLSLDGVSVTVGGVSATLAYISPGQVNVLAPLSVTGTVSVTLTNSGGSASFTANLSAGRATRWFKTQPVH
jgi:uncharacterized protein (TIGR03437 family)